MAREVPAEVEFRDRPWLVGFLLVLPVVGLALLIARPELDVAWEHHPSHFWLVLVTAVVNVVLAYLTNIAAGRYRDVHDRRMRTFGCVRHRVDRRHERVCRDGRQLRDHPRGDGRTVPGRWLERS